MTGICPVCGGPYENGLTDETPLSEIAMSIRLKNVLKYEGATTIGEARLILSDPLAKYIPNLGRVSFSEWDRIMKSVKISENTVLTGNYPAGSLAAKIKSNSTKGTVELLYSAPGRGPHLRSILATGAKRNAPPAHEMKSPAQTSKD